MQSDDFSDDCSGENVNVDGHVAIDKGTVAREMFRLFPCLVVIHPIHAAAMFNRMRGLEGKYAQHYVNRDVT